MKMSRAFSMYFLFTGCLFSAFASGQEPSDNGGALRYHEPLTIRYNVPGSGYSGFLKDSDGMIVLATTHLLDVPDTLRMVKEGDGWKASFVLNDTTCKMVFLAFQATDGSGREIEDLTDDNDATFWCLPVSDEKGDPVRGAWETSALFFTGLGGLVEEDLNRAKEDVAREIALYHDNYSARQLHLSIRLKESGSSRTVCQRIEREIDGLLKSDRPDAAVLGFAAKAYRMIGENGKADKTDQKLIEQDPASDRSAMKSLQKIVAIENAQDRSEALESFLVEFPGSRYTEYALSGLATTAIDMNNTDEMIRIGDRLLNVSSTPSGASGLAGVAGVLSENRLYLERSAAYIQKALDIVLTVSPDANPPEIPPNVWRNQLRQTRARYRDILANILIAQTEYDEALSHLMEAAEVLSQSSVYYHMGLAYHGKGLLDEALIQYARASVFGEKMGEKARDELKILWEETGHEAGTLEAFVENQKEWLVSAAKQDILEERNIREAPGFELMDIHGDRIRLTDQRGGVVVLCFWASWSRSSKMLLDKLESFSYDFGQDVLFLTVATDRERQDVVDWVRRQKITLPVLFNEETDEAYGISGVPVLYIIDGNGNIHFEHKGYKPDIESILTVELEDLL